MENGCGQNIKKLREQNGLTRQELANIMTELGLERTEKAIEEMEQQRRKVLDSDIITFAIIFKKSLEEVILDRNDW